MHRLRYYAPAFKAEDDADIRALLASVRSNWGIDHEIVEIPHLPGVFPGHIQTDEAYEARLYQSHFASRATVLKSRTGIPVKRALRSRSGGYYLRGTVAIVSPAGVEWHCRYETRFRNGDQDEAIGFLQTAQQQGPDLLAELCASVPQRLNVEQEITGAFLRSDVLSGSIEREVKIGYQKHHTDVGTFKWRRKIDLLIRCKEQHWVIESKQTLNYEAFGQILCYAYLYQLEHPNAAVQAGIVCARVNGELRLLCQAYRVTVFELTPDGVKVHAP